MENKLKKKINTASVSCGKITKDLTLTSQIPKREKKVQGLRNI